MHVTCNFSGNFHQKQNSPIIDTWIWKSRLYHGRDFTEEFVWNKVFNVRLTIFLWLINFSTCLSLLSSQQALCVGRKKESFPCFSKEFCCEVNANRVEPQFLKPLCALNRYIATEDILHVWYIEAELMNAFWVFLVGAPLKVARIFIFFLQMFEYSVLCEC